MTINDFVAKYKRPDEEQLNIDDEYLDIGVSSVRTFCKTNQSKLVEENIIKIVKKIKSERIVIIDSKKLLNEINKGY